MTRYKEAVRDMIEQNKKIFDEFQKLHDRYSLDKQSLQDEFNEKGKIVMDLVRKYEDRLCGKSESTGYGAYTGNLAEKFQQEVRKHFPLIDYVGIKMKTNPAFSLKKINL